jgi:putative protease
MTLADARAVAFARGLGIARVILPRELTLEQIGRIAASAADVTLEAFVHGALCISYSGQCLASLALGGRSGNRGACAQACRLPYRLVVDGAPRAGDGGPHVLSPRDLAAHDRIPELLRAGVRAFKIEGRLKDARYVAAAVRAYRAALDAAAAGHPFAMPDDLRAGLEQSFSRGFTRGYLDGTAPAALVDPQSPSHRGVLVGTVVGKRANALVVTPLADDPLKPGDGVLLEGGGPGAAAQGGRVYAVSPCGTPRRGRRTQAAGPGEAPPPIEVRFGRGDVDLAAVPAGSRVWKTGDPAVRRRLEGTYARDTVARRVPLTLRVSAPLGGPLRVALRDDAGREAMAAWDGPLARAERHPLTLDLLRDQFGRLGQTPYELAGVEADTLDPVMVPKSVLNTLRRQAVDALTGLRRAGAARDVAEPDALAALRRDLGGRRPAPDAPAAAPSLVVLVRTPAQLDAALDGGAGAPGRQPALVYVDAADPGLGRDALAGGRKAGIPVALATPRIVRPGEEGLLRAIAELAPDAVLVRSAAARSFFRATEPAASLVGDYPLNAANDLAFDLLAEGLVRLAPAFDLDEAAFAALLARVDPARVEAVVHLHAPLFHTQHCLFAANLGGGRDCAGCPRPCDRLRLELEDRKGVRHPVLADAAGRNTVFHGKAHSRAESVPALAAAGVRYFRVELLGEDAAETREILDGYAGVLAGRVNGGALRRRLNALKPVQPAVDERGGRDV